MVSDVVMPSVGLTAALIAVIMIIVLIVLALYLYVAFAWMTIAKRRNHKYPWFAFIPILNVLQIIQIGGLHWAWIFTSVPVIFSLFFPEGIKYTLLSLALAIPLMIVMTVAMWRVLEKENYAGEWALLYAGMIIPVVNFFASIGYMVLIGVVAWGKKRSAPEAPVKAPSRSTAVKPAVRKAPVKKVKTSKKPSKKVKKKAYKKASSRKK